MRRNIEKHKKDLEKYKINRDNHFGRIGSVFLVSINILVILFLIFVVSLIILGINPLK